MDNKLIQIPINKNRTEQRYQQAKTTNANQQVDKPKTSRGSILFSQMQSLTNKIKNIDTVQQKLIQDKFNRSREGSVTSKKDDIGVISGSDQTQIKQINQKIQQGQCFHCKKKSQEIIQLQFNLKKIQRQLESQQKQVIYLNFQLDLAKQQNKVNISKPNIDSYKLLIRKALEKFMSNVVLAKITDINNSISTVEQKIDTLSSEYMKQSTSSSSSPKKAQKSVQYQSTKAEGSTLIPTSSTINMRKRSATKQGQLSNQKAKIKQLDAKIKQKDTLIVQLQKQLSVRRNQNIILTNQYQSLKYQSQTPKSQDSSKLKQLQQKLLVSQKQYRKLNQRYIAIKRKQQQLNIQLQEHRLKVLAFEKVREKFQNMQKQMLLQTRQLQRVRIQHKQQKDTNNSHMLIINKLKQKLQQVQFELSLKQQQPQQQNINSKPNKLNIDKQFKIFEESNNKLKLEIKRLNQSLHEKVNELENTHDQYRNQLYEKQKKLLELENIMRGDFSKIRQSRDSDWRISRESDNSLMFSTTKINSSKDFEFILSDGQIILPQFPNLDQLFSTKDFSKVQLQSHYDQQQFLRKVSDYIDTIRLSASRRKSKSRSRNSSQQKQKDIKRSSQLKTLVENMINQINRINKQVPSLIKQQFFKLKSLLDKFMQQLPSIQSNNYLLNQLKDLSVLLVKTFSKDKNSKQTDDIIKMMKNLLRMSTI